MSLENIFLALRLTYLNKKPHRIAEGLFITCCNSQRLLAEIDFDIPVLDLHGAVLRQVLLHFEATIEQLRLMADAAGQAVF